MKVRSVLMTYDRDLERWVAEGKDEWYGLRCGELLKLHLGQKTLEGRLELGRSTWYINVNGVGIGLLQGERYTVTINI